MEYKDILQTESKFRYQLLSRLQGDCDYYLGYGDRSKKRLWAGDEEEQIKVMKILWESFSIDDKPEWIPWCDILDYEYKMIQI